MIYVKKIGVLTILISCVGTTSSSLHAAAHNYRSLTEAMKAGDQGAIQSIVNQQQSQDRFKYNALDLQANPQSNPERWGKAPLHKAAYFFGGNPATSTDKTYLAGVRSLLETLSHQDAQRVLNQQSADGATPLHIVAGHKDEDWSKPQAQRKQVPETIKEPVKRKLNDDAYRFAGRLLEHQADLNAQDKNGLTPLHWAVRHKNERLVKMLLNKGANANIRDLGDKLPLHWAAIGGYTPIIQQLLQVTNSNFINHKDKRGRTPLQWVLRSREGAVAYEGGAKHMPKAKALENIGLLLQQGADPTIKDNEGYDAFHWANQDEKNLFSNYGYQLQQQAQPLFASQQPQHIAARQQQEALRLQQQREQEKQAAEDLKFAQQLQREEQARQVEQQRRQQQEATDRELAERLAQQLGWQ